ncbi:hypothetical protein LOZ66_003589 [Ophidiomyces ophidiicola]|nr:hypothetical protein LOZ66_003589 [Ophidiomyces ophidiicola]
MERGEASLISSGESLLTESLKSREASKYTPRSAGSVQRPQRSEDVLELVRFFTDCDGSYPEGDFMGFGNGTVSDFWVSKDAPKAKKWKSQEDLSRLKGWQKPGLKWRKDKNKQQKVEENRPPPISKDTKVPQLLLQATRSKSTAGDVDCECFYPGIGTLPAVDLSNDLPKRLGSLTSMWTPPTLEVPLTPSSSEFSPTNENRNKVASDSVGNHSDSRSPTKSKEEKQHMASEPCHSPAITDKVKGPVGLRDRNITLNGKSIEKDAGSNQRPIILGNAFDSQKRGGVCVPNFQQTEDMSDSAFLLAASQKQSTYIDSQYLPTRTSSRRNRPQEQVEVGIRQPRPEQYAVSSLQTAASGNRSASCFSEPETSSTLITLPARKQSRRPAPLILSADHQSEIFPETWPPTPATSTMASSNNDLLSGLYPSSKSLPLTPTEAVPPKGGESKVHPIAESKPSSLWPARLHLRSSHGKITQGDTINGNAFAQMSLPTSPTTLLDPSALQQESQRRASEAPHISSSIQNGEVVATIISEYASHTNRADEGGVSPKSNLANRGGFINGAAPRLSLSIRSSPGDPPQIPLPANPPISDSPQSSLTKVRRETFGSTKQIVLSAPANNDETTGEFLGQKTPKSAKGWYSVAASPRNSQSSDCPRRERSTIPHASWDMVDLGIPSRSLTPSLPSSDDENGVYAYCGSVSRSDRPRRRYRQDTLSTTVSPIQRKKDRGDQDSSFVNSRPSTRNSLDERRQLGIASFRSSGSESALIQELQSKIIALEQQNEVLRAALSAAIDTSKNRCIGENGDEEHSYLP